MRTDTLWIVGGIIVAAAVALYVAYANWPVWFPPQGSVACTLDAKLCPDGSYVGRVPPTCEFAACPAATSTSPQAVRDVVEEFGTRLQLVSLLASTSSAVQAMEEQYGPYVDAALLSQWKANPSEAPGRKTSSPWPDHIEITSIEPQGAGYLARGDVVEMTSTGIAGRTLVVLELRNTDGEWRITSFSEE